MVIDKGCGFGSAINSRNKTETNFTCTPMVRVMNRHISRNQNSVFKFEPPEIKDEKPFEKQNRRLIAKYTLKMTSRLAWMFDYRRRLKLVHV